MTNTSSNFWTAAKNDAREMAIHFLDEIFQQLVDEGEVSRDVNNDYPNGDSYHHENHVDISYDLRESAEILSDLRRYKETDSGLWKGLEPEDAIEAQAAYTYGNAVSAHWGTIITLINNDSLLADALTDMGEGQTDAATVRQIILGIIMDNDNVE